MKRFQFQLERVLEVRVVQARIEQEALHKLSAARATMRDRLVHLEQDSAATFLAPLEQQRAAADYRRFLAGRAKRIQGDLTQLDAQIAAQQAKLAEAERRAELLRRLKDRRLAEWNAAHARELDELAADAHRARLRAASGRVEKG
jgi:hypothetical protein